MANKKVTVEGKQYPVPEELRQLMGEAFSALDLRDRFIKLPFCYKKALRAGADYRLKKASFWRKFYKLYPDVTTTNLWYDLGADFVYEKESQ